ncbi:MAG: M15 family metallopeptidase [Lachnospiraceae bacterium]|nr:M15 family metallopeptidase [Lachnospiraceae bacterium]
MRALKLSPEQVHSGSLILVNRDYDYKEPSFALNGNAGTEALSLLDGHPVLLKRRAAVLFTGLMDEIGGWPQIVPVSGYRTLKEQTDIWNRSLAEYGQAFTKAYVALPGHSEHQTGLAIDLGIKKKEIDFLRPDFPDSGICRMFKKKAPQYGFIHRYPSGRENITGINHEPWHFRYVGTPHGEIMEREGLTLEEYIFFLRDFPHGKRPYLFTQGKRPIAVSWLKARRNEGTWLSVDDGLPYSVSGDNVDGFIITEWRDGYVS